MVHLNVPPFLVDCRDVGVLKRRVTGDEIENANTFIFVCEGLTGYLDGHIHAAKVPCFGCILFPIQLTDGDELSGSFVCFAVSEGAIAFEGKDEMLFLTHNKFHVLL